MSGFDELQAALERAGSHALRDAQKHLDNLKAHFGDDEHAQGELDALAGRLAEAARGENAGYASGGIVAPPGSATSDPPIVAPPTNVQSRQVEGTTATAEPANPDPEAPTTMNADDQAEAQAAAPQDAYPASEPAPSPVGSVGPVDEGQTATDNPDNPNTTTPESAAVTEASAQPDPTPVGSDPVESPAVVPDPATEGTINTGGQDPAITQEVNPSAPADPAPVEEQRPVR